MPLRQSQTVISDEEFAKFCEFFHRKTGIMFDVQKKYFAERRVLDRMARLWLRDVPRVFRDTPLLEAAGDEMQRLVNQMTVNETYFFREDYQLKALVAGILPDLAGRSRKGQPIRIWSVPCSSGEEPYSLAIYILENWAAADRYDIQILASDIDSAILADAAAGLYAERSLQRLPPDLIRRYFTRQKDRDYRISDDIRWLRRFLPGQCRRSLVHAYVSRHRCHFLPEHADLFRRPVAARNRRGDV